MGDAGSDGSAINAGNVCNASVVGSASMPGGDGGLGMQGWTGWCGAADGEGIRLDARTVNGRAESADGDWTALPDPRGLWRWRVSLRPVAKKAAAGIDSNQAAEGLAGRLTPHIPGGEAADQRLRHRGCVLSWAGRLT